MADSKLTALTEISVPALEDLTYWVDDPSGTPAERKCSMTRAFGLLTFINQFRLTTESGVAVSTSDRTAQGTIYWTPYVGSLVSLYDGTRWRLYSSAQISLGLTATSGKNYDVFVYDNAGTVTLELSAAWSDDVTRVDALTTQDGVKVKSGALTRRWVGTIRASGTNVTADVGGGVTTQVGAKRFVWNAYNQVRRDMKVIDTTDNWAYATNTIRQAGGVAGNKIEYVTGDAATYIDAAVHGNALLNANSAAAARAGVGLDSTTAFYGIIQNGYNTGGSNSNNIPMTGRYSGTPGLGYHYISWNEAGADGTCYMLGSNLGGQTGMIASALM